MINGLSLRKAAKIVKVSHVTLFYWRHKILSAIKKMQLDKFEGIIEGDEPLFRERQEKYYWKKSS